MSRRVCLQVRFLLRRCSALAVATAAPASSFSSLAVTKGSTLHCTSRQLLKAAPPWTGRSTPARPLTSRTHGGSNQDDDADGEFGDLTSSKRDISFQVSRLQVESALRAGEQEVRIPEFDGRYGGPSPVLRFHSNQVGANVPLEDRRCAATCLRTPGMLFGVFDGHGGHACAQAVSERLPYYVATAMMHESCLEDLEVAMETGRPVPPILQWYKHHGDYNYRDSAQLYVQHLRVYWQELLGNEEHGEGMSPADALRHAFLRLDADLSLEAQIPLANELMRNTAIQSAFAGTTACLALVNGNGVYVANAGDCRAVLGVEEEDGSWSALALSRDHTALDAAELERVRSQHPPSERRSVVVDERLLGMLIPLRAFGDVRFKWSRELQRSVLDKVLENSGATYHHEEELHLFQYAPPNYLTPPYLDACPEVTYHALRPRDRFLILASDGLWDELTNEEAVRLVGQHLSGVRVQAPVSTATHQRQLSLGQMQQLLLRRRARAAPARDENAATLLIRHALATNEYGELDPERLAAMMALPDDLARMYRDDITVTVVYFNTHTH